MTERWRGELLDGRYQLTERLQDVELGQVWRGLDTVLGRSVAITCLRPDLAADESFRNAFRQAMRTAGGTRHRRPAVFDYGESTMTVDGQASPGEPVAYVVEELMPGPWDEGDPGGVLAPIEPFRPPSIAVSRDLS